MKISIEELICRYVDGEMEPSARAAFENRLNSDLSLRRELEEIQGVSSLIKDNLKIEEPPFPDFFNSHLHRRIAEDSVCRSKAPAWWRWFTSPWMIPATAAMTGLLVAWSIKNNPDRSTEDGNITLVSNVYSPETDKQPTSYYDKNAKATIIMLDNVKSLEFKGDLPFYIHRDSVGASKANLPNIALEMDADRPINSNSNSKIPIVSLNH